MLRFIPPTHKAIKRKNRQNDDEEAQKLLEEEEHTTLLIQFASETGEVSGTPMEIPKDVNPQQLQTLINSILENDEKLPYSFFLNQEEITADLQSVVTKQGLTVETVLTIVYRPQALFRVNSVARCSSTLPGHQEAILHVSFSSDGRNLASGSGDGTVRIWDTKTETPRNTLRGHNNWVLAVAWSGCGKKLGSGGMDCDVRIWDPITAKQLGKTLKGHRKPVTCIVWEPMIYSGTSTRLASASKDNTIRVWDTIRSTCLFSYSGHTHPLRSIKWGGEGYIYSGGQDRHVKVWSVEEKKLVRSMEGHAHWVNCLSTNTEYVLRQGPYDHQGLTPAQTPEEIKALCEKKYNAITVNRGELLVSCSDDFTLYLWNPTKSSKPVTRLTGHQQPVNYVMYSPDGNYIASASFDKSVRIWDGTNGKFLYAFRGHVQSVYQVAWSADSRLLVSSSKDSTIKLWHIAKKKMLEDLPGHADEVYAVDWSPDGHQVASGGKDKVLKVWSS